MPTLGSKIRKRKALRDRGRQMYREAGELDKEIVSALLAKGGRAKISRTETAVLKDKFAEKLTDFKNVGFDRYEIEIETTADAGK